VAEVCGSNFTGAGAAGATAGAGAPPSGVGVAAGAGVAGAAGTAGVGTAGAGALGAAGADGAGVAGATGVSGIACLLCSFDKYLQWLSATVVTCNEPTIMDDCVQWHGTAEIKLLETKARREIISHLHHDDHATAHHFPPAISLPASTVVSTIVLAALT